MYSLKMSVCSVPFSLPRSAPCRSAAARYMQNTGTAGPLIVIEVVTSASGMPSNRMSMSAAESMATPQCPTSPRALGSSESRPISVGMSNATDSPVPPAPSSILYRSLVCRALPNPENWRMVHGRARYPVGYRPRVNGNSPGQPIRSKPGTTAPAGGPYTGSTSSPESVLKSASRTRDASYRRCQRSRPASIGGSVRSAGASIAALLQARY